MSKDEKQAHANYKIMKGLALVVFGLVWAFFTSYSVDVWSALPLTIAVMGLLLFLYGIIKKASV